MTQPSTRTLADSLFHKLYAKAYAWHCAGRLRRLDVTNETAGQVHSLAADIDAINSRQGTIAPPDGIDKDLLCSYVAALDGEVYNNPDFHNSAMAITKVLRHDAQPSMSYSSRPSAQYIDRFDTGQSSTQYASVAAVTTTSSSGISRASNNLRRPATAYVRAWDHNGKEHTLRETGTDSSYEYIGPERFDFKYVSCKRQENGTRVIEDYFHNGTQAKGWLPFRRVP